MMKKLKFSLGAVLKSMADQKELDPRLIDLVFRHYDMLSTIRESAQNGPMQAYMAFQNDLERSLKNGSIDIATFH